MKLSTSMVDKLRKRVGVKRLQGLNLKDRFQFQLSSTREGYHQVWAEGNFFVSQYNDRWNGDLTIKARRLGSTVERPVTYRYRYGRATWDVSLKFHLHWQDGDKPEDEAKTFGDLCDWVERKIAYSIEKAFIPDEYVKVGTAKRPLLQQLEVDLGVEQARFARFVAAYQRDVTALIERWESMTKQPTKFNASTLEYYGYRQDKYVEMGMARQAEVLKRQTAQVAFLKNRIKREMERADEHPQDSV